MEALLSRTMYSRDRLRALPATQRPGTEGDGISTRTLAQVDVALRIPMSHGVDSLNVAAAAAVAFWATCR